MNYEIKDCIDAGSPYCPCHLAETGDCIICSQLSGKDFCDCINWKGVCILQEFVWNGNKAKEGRGNYEIEILEAEEYNPDIYLFTCSVSHKMAVELQYAGSYAFFRNKDTNTFYDVPISIMEADIDKNTIKFAIEMRGIKTKSLKDLGKGNKINIRTPYYNGILGLKKILRVKGGNSIVCARGIGAAPSIPVIKKLNSLGSSITFIYDSAKKDLDFIKPYLYKYCKEIIELNTLNSGELSKEYKDEIKTLVEKEDIDLFHVDGPDILIFKTLEYFKNLYCSKMKIAEDVADEVLPFTSSNNAKMCCGEGICGACSVRYKNHVVKRLCKYQSNPSNIFKDRRLI